MDYYLLILHEIEDATEDRLEAIEEVIVRLGGGERKVIQSRLRALPVILCDHLSSDEIGIWQSALESAGAGVEIMPSVQVGLSGDSTPLPDLSDLEGTLDDLLGDAAPVPGAAVAAEPASASPPPPAKPPEKKKELKPADNFDFNLDLGGSGISQVVSESAKSKAPAPAPNGADAKRATLEFSLDDGDALEARLRDNAPAAPPEIKAAEPVAAPRPATPKPASKPAASAKAPEAGKDSEGEAPNEDSRPKIPKTKAPEKRAIASSSVSVSKRDNRVTKTMKPASSVEKEIPKTTIRYEQDPAEAASIAKQAAGAQAAAGESAAPARRMSGSQTALPVQDAAPGKRPAGTLIVLLLVFLVLPIAYLIIPEQKSKDMNPEMIQALLKQQEKVLEDMKTATPAPTSQAPVAPLPPVIHDFALHEEQEKIGLDIDLRIDQNGLRAAALSLRGRKFWPLMQQEPKAVDQNMIFVREITAKSLQPDETAKELGGEGEALIWSGTAPYRVPLNVVLLASADDASANVTLIFTGKQFGGVDGGGQGVEQVGQGEFKITMRRNFILKRVHEDPEESADSTATPTPGKVGSYQRIPMELLKPKKQPTPLARR